MREEQVREAGGGHREVASRVPSRAGQETRMEKKQHGNVPRCVFVFV